MTCKKCNGTGQYVAFGGIVKKCDCREEKKIENVPHETITENPLNSLKINEKTLTRSEKMKENWRKRKALKQNVPRETI